MSKAKIIRFLFITGIVLLILGAIDPLEGSVVIAAGSILLAFTTAISHDRYRKLFMASMVLTLTGVFFLFYLSSQGGFGVESTLSWWWALLILPYPIGWIIDLTLLIIKAARAARSGNPT